jgi:hypothetical protein
MRMGMARSGKRGVKPSPPGMAHSRSCNRTPPSLGRCEMRSAPGRSPVTIGHGWKQSSDNAGFRSRRSRRSAGTNPALQRSPELPPMVMTRAARRPQQRMRYSCVQEPSGRAEVDATCTQSGVRRWSKGPGRAIDIDADPTRARLIAPTHQGSCTPRSKRRASGRSSPLKPREPSPVTDSAA